MSQPLYLFGPLNSCLMPILIFTPFVNKRCKLVLMSSVYAAFSSLHQSWATLSLGLNRSVGLGDSASVRRLVFVECTQNPVSAVLPFMQVLDFLG